jgi:WD40 repeat protein
LAGHDGAVFALAFSGDGQRLFTAGFEGLIRAFDPASGKLTAIFLPVKLSPAKAVVSR